MFSLGCGALIGDAMIHILPEAYKSPVNNPVFVSLTFISSLLFFLVLERIFHAIGLTHSHWGEKECGDHSREVDQHHTTKIEISPKKLSPF